MVAGGYNIGSRSKDIMHVTLGYTVNVGCVLAVDDGEIDFPFVYAAAQVFLQIFYSGAAGDVSDGKQTQLHGGGPFFQT